MELCWNARVHTRHLYMPFSIRANPISIGISETWNSEITVTSWNHRFRIWNLRFKGCAMLSHDQSIRKVAETLGKVAWQTLGEVAWLLQVQGPDSVRGLDMLLKPIPPIEVSLAEVASVGNSKVDFTYVAIYVNTTDGFLTLVASHFFLIQNCPPCYKMDSLWKSASKIEQNLFLFPMYLFI